MPKKTVCVKVPKIQGEKTITFLKKMDLVDKTLKIQRDEHSLYIPLTHTPEKGELQPLNDQIPDLELSTHMFPKRKREPETLTELLEGQLPQDLLSSLPRAIDFVGDIAIVRIPPELKAYKKVIGEALLKLHKNVRTVLAKAGAVTGTHRLRDFDLIAGEPDTETIHKEYGCRYLVDVSQAYFSPRLSYEHHRVSSLVQNGETVVDLFTGVGPFPVMIAKTHENVRVYAIDINPHAVHYLKENIDLNNVEGKVHPILGGAEEVVHRKLSSVADRVIMNLPGKAIQFVNASCETLKPTGGVVHFYSFISKSETLEDLKNQFAHKVEEHGREVEEFLSSRIVRGTAPYQSQAVLDALIR